MHKEKYSALVSYIIFNINPRDPVITTTYLPNEDVAVLIIGGYNASPDSGDIYNTTEMFGCDDGPRYFCSLHLLI